MNDQQLLGCTHYWIIESAKGPSSKGICNFCGTTKVFDNSIPFEKEFSGWKVGKADEGNRVGIKL